VHVRVRVSPKGGRTVMQNGPFQKVREKRQGEKGGIQRHPEGQKMTERENQNDKRGQYQGGKRERIGSSRKGTLRNIRKVGR